MGTVRVITFELEGLPPGPNIRVRYHWRKRAQVDKAWKERTYYAAIEAQGRRASIDHAKVTITHYLPDKRRRDADNLRASTKNVLDGIVAAGLIRDDSLTEIGEVEHHFEYRKGNPGLRITVEPRA